MIDCQIIEIFAFEKSMIWREFLPQMTGFVKLADHKNNHLTCYRTNERV